MAARLRPTQTIGQVCVSKEQTRQEGLPRFGEGREVKLSKKPHSVPVLLARAHDFGSTYNVKVLRVNE